MLPRAKIFLLRGISFTLAVAGFLVVLYGLRFAQKGVPQTTGNMIGQGQILDLNDPAVANNLRSIVFSGLEPGTLTIDQKGNLVTETVKNTEENFDDKQMVSQIVGGITPVVSGWKKSNQNVILETLTDKVGIGVSSPTSALQVNGNITAGADNQSMLGTEVNRWLQVNVGAGG